MRLQDWGLLAGQSLIWGASFLFAKVAVGYVPPLTLVLARVSIAAFALWIACRMAGKPGLQGFVENWQKFLLLGFIASALPFALLFWAQTRIGAGLSSILNATTPVFTALLAVFVFRAEKAEARIFGGIALGIAGVVSVVGPSALIGAGADPVAQLAVLGTACSYGIAGNYAQKFRHLPSLTVAGGQMAGAAVVIAPFALFLDRPWEMAMPPIHAVGAVLALALICTAYAYALFYKLIQRAGAISASLVTILVPPVAAFLSAIFLGERLGVQHAVGLLLIFAGLLVMDRTLRGFVVKPFKRGT
ncbi:DMT family transporter [Lacibacterium aquatile]|uniref:DMT family transporter n=1 Tax=Lacibacterium aquatile TaxID=1168082 RepID=A0ABW5DV17_9PROT